MTKPGKKQRLSIYLDPPVMKALVEHSARRDLSRSLVAEAELHLEVGQLGRLGVDAGRPLVPSPFLDGEEGRLELADDPLFEDTALFLSGHGLDLNP